MGWEHAGAWDRVWLHSIVVASGPDRADDPSDSCSGPVGRALPGLQRDREVLGRSGPEVAGVPVAGVPRMPRAWMGQGLGQIQIDGRDVGRS